MPQETNFNVSPYFDDFDKDKDYYRVLFKPGYPVQARELTTSQSILQNQIEQFGSKFFKEGEIVIPGTVSYNNPIYAVEIDPSYNGFPISLYFKSLLGKKIQGLSSGVTAEVLDLIEDKNSERGNFTLYVKYLESGGQDLTIKQFQDGETLVSLSIVSYGENNKFSIQANQGIFNTISINCNSKASSVSISDGVCFVRGIFANVLNQSLILEQYNTNPSYKIGFDIIEKIVNSDEDESLFDNARSFTNYTAPGADRLKLELILSKKELDDIELDGFVEIMRVVNGIPQFPRANVSEIKPVLAAKTESAKVISDVSGDFFVKPFTVYVRDSLNDGVLNNGVYFSNQTTVSGNTPSEDKLVYQIGPGKAYIGGYTVETTSARLLDAPKPRTSLDTCTKEVISYNAGTLFILNNTFGSPSVGLGTDSTISLMSNRLGLNRSVAAGTTIGVARVYDYVPESEYKDNLSRMHLRLFDIQTYTVLNFEKSIPVFKPSHFQGAKSGATGHALDFSPVVDISSATFNTVGIESVFFSSTGITTITTFTNHNLNVGERIYINGSGEEQLDYQTAGKFTVLSVDNILIPRVGLGTTALADPGQGFTIDVNEGIGGLQPSDLLFSVSGFGNLTESTENARINATSHGLIGGEDIYIENSSNPNYNGNFTVGTIINANTFTLSGLTAENYYFGPTSAVWTKPDSGLVGLTTIRLYEVNGKFLNNERVIINGIEQGRVIKNVLEYDLNDVKSVYSYSGISTFNADLILDNKSSLAPSGTLFRVSAAYNGISTISSVSFGRITENLKENDIILWNNYKAPEGLDGVPIPTYNKVLTIDPDGKSFTVTGITTVTNYISGGVFVDIANQPNEVTNIQKVSSLIYGSPDSESLLTKLNNINISSIDIENNLITQRRLFKNVPVSGNQLTITISPTEEDLFFAEFDEDRYVITYSNGNKESIRFDKFSIGPSGKTATFVDLSQSTGSADVISTITNTSLNSKTKKFNRSEVLNIKRSKYPSSGIGQTTLNDGLTYSLVYGTRIQDNEISLNIPDVVRVIGVFESSNENDATLPSLQITGSNAQNYVVGEQLIGETSGAAALLINKVDTNVLEFVYLNSKTFEKGEVLLAKESSLRTNVNSISLGDRNITQNFDLDNGQSSSYYGYSKLIRRKNIEEPKKSLKIVFQHYSVDPSDTGEIFTANSYSENNFKHDVPIYNDNRVSDYLDLRPRVSKYDLSSDKSPFEFSSRSFSSDGQYSKYILAPGENIQVCYKYYVGRIDKIVLNSDGTFSAIQGTPGIRPIEPDVPDNSLEIAKINLPPYVFNIQNVEVSVERHRKYTMQDISLLEDRIKRLEEFTILTTLENKTENLSIKDADTGLERFKCGFFVDTFKNTNLHNEEDPDYKVSIDDQLNVLRPTHYTTSLDMQLGSEVISGVGETFDPTKDHDYVSDLGSDGIRKTGDLITLNYQDIEYFNQPYATRTESVTPFLVKYWTGSIQLNPPSDTWIEEREIVNQSFNTRTTNLPQEPDINVSITRNVIRNQVVFRNEVVTQRGIWRRRWITSNGSFWRRSGWSRGNRNWRNANWVESFRYNTRGLSTSVVNVNGRQAVQFRAYKWGITEADINWLSRILPRDVADSYITQIRQRTPNQAIFLNYAPGSPDITRVTESTTTSVVAESSTVRTTIPPEIREETTVEENISNFTEPTRFLRSRNIEFDVKGLRPRTRFYSFFEGIDVNKYIIPKLLEIEMISGKFEIGEIIESDPHFTSKKIRFRACKPNHKVGPFANPTETFNLIPYRQSAPPENYTEASDYINVDTRALQLLSEVDFYGEIAINMKIIGKKSGAIARITNSRLVSDNTGRLIGSLYVPDPKVPGNPQWINGENTFTVIDTPSLSELASGDQNVTNESSAEEDFTSSSTTNVTQRNILTTRNTIIRPSRNVNTTTITNTQTTTTAITNTTIQGRGDRLTTRWEVRDPLAQSFYVKDETGIFLTGVDVYFETIDESIPVTLQIRTMENGTPTNTVLPFSEVTLDPSSINVSTDGTLATRFRFASPVYLSGPQAQEVRGAPIASEVSNEYAVVLQSNSSNYRVFISRLGENDILTNVKVGSQPTLGSLFKSQNGTTWTPSQLEDLKYKLHRADFVNSGVVRYYNPKLSLKNNKVTVLGENQITALSKRSVAKIAGSETLKADVLPGVTIYQENRAKSKLIGIGGSITSGIGITISNPGIGYTPTSGTYTFNNISLISVTGSGKGASADITVNNGVISSTNIINGGYGYQSGDQLTIPSIGQDVGFGGQFTVNSISIKNTLILDNIVKGSSTSSGSLFDSLPIYYVPQSGIGTYVTESESIVEILDEDLVYDGQHLLFNAINHGMHSNQNYVRISNIRPEEDEPNRLLGASLSATETTLINIGDTSGFETFEGSPISNTNPGYVIIGNEIVGYTTYTATSLGGGSQTILRGIDGTESQQYDTNIPVYRYQFNGISLRRINKIHNLASVDTDTHPVTLNSFYIKVPSSDTDINVDPNTVIGPDIGNSMVFDQTSILGDSGAIVSTNIQYEILTPNFATIKLARTNINAKVRTFSATSVHGNESSFEDQGYVDISLDQPISFPTPRLIASVVNEERNIKNVPGNRSLSMEITLTTEDSRVSPVIDDVTTSVILTSNLINAPAGVGKNSLFADVEYIRGGDDLHEAVYITKPIGLKLPANSLKVFLKSSRSEDNDIRVLYKLFRKDSPSGNSNFEPFPGFSNYQVDSSGIKRVIDASKNDGSADSEDTFSSGLAYNDYEYTVDNLPEFTGFAIKIILASKNQAQPPLVKDLRGIATLKPSI
jgi:hypothetical protein